MMMMMMITTTNKKLFVLSRWCLPLWRRVAVWQDTTSSVWSGKAPRNVGILPQNYTASQPRRPWLESSPPWIPEVSHYFYLLWSRYVFMSWCLVKHRNFTFNFTVTFIFTLLAPIVINQGLHLLKQINWTCL